MLWTKVIILLFHFLAFNSPNTGNIQIQPLADHPDPPPNVGQGPPLPASVPAERGANPYRIGTGMVTRKPNYGVSGIASFGSAPPSSSGSSMGTQPSQPMVPPATFQPAQPLQQSQPFQVCGTEEPDINVVPS